MAARHTQRGSRGYVLILSLLILHGLIGFVAVGMTRSALELRTASRTVDIMQAFYLAEYGLECAIEALRTDTSANVATACSVTIDESQGNGQLKATSTGSVQASNTQITVEAILQRNDPSPFQQAVYATLDSPTQTGIWVYSGSWVDSYDSSLGGYNTWIAAESRWNVAAHGDVQTTSSRPEPPGGNQGAIRLKGASQVQGDAATAPGGGVHIEADGSTVTGAIGTQPPTTFASVTTPSAPTCTAENTLGDLVVGSGTILDKLGGIYCASSITVTAGGNLTFPNLNQLYVVGNVTVDTGGSIHIGQGTVSTQSLMVADVGSLIEGTSGQLDLYVSNLLVERQAVMRGAADPQGVPAPERLRIYSDAISPPENYGTQHFEIEIKSQAQVYGTLYVPTARVRMNSFDGASQPTAVYGALISQETRMNRGAGVHFDEVLTASTNWPTWMGGSGASQVDVLAWYVKPPSE